MRRQHLTEWYYDLGRSGNIGFKFNTYYVLLGQRPINEGTETNMFPCWIFLLEKFWLLLWNLGEFVQLYCDVKCERQRKFVEQSRLFVQQRYGSVLKTVVETEIRDYNRQANLERTLTVCKG